MENTQDLSPRSAQTVYEQRLAYFTAEIEAARAEHISQSALITSLRTQKDTCESEKFHIQKENKVLSTEIELLRHKIGQMTKELEKNDSHKASKSSTERKSKESKIKEQIDKVNLMAVGIRDENKKLRIENSDLKAKLTQATLEKDTSGMQLIQYQTNFKRLQEKLEKVTEEFVFATANIDELNSKIEQLQAENKQYIEEIVPLKDTQLKYDLEAQRRQEQIEEFAKQKKEYLDQKCEFETEKSKILSENDTLKSKVAELTKMLEVEKVKQNKIQQDNLQLKHNLNSFVNSKSQVDIKALVDLLKADKSKNIFGVGDTKLSDAMKTISTLKSEIFQLRLQLDQERHDKERIQILHTAKKGIFGENESKFKWNSLIKGVVSRAHQSDSESKSDKSKNTTQNYCHKEFVDMIKEHSKECDKNQQCCSYDFLSKLISCEDEEHVQKIANNLKIKDKKDAIAAIPKLIKEKDSQILALQEDLSRLEKELETIKSCEQSAQPSKITAKKSVRFEEAVKATFDKEKSENLTVDMYIESVCNNKKLAREIHETLQILLMKEKREIAHIKEITQVKDKDIDIDLRKQLEDAKSEVEYFKAQTKNISKLKDLVEEQLTDEYTQNRELRTECKDLSDELLMTKETLCNLELENYQLKNHLAKVESVKEWMADVNKKALQMSINGVKSKLAHQQTVEKTVRGIIANTIASSKILKSDKEEYLALIEELEKKNKELEQKLESVMEVDKDAGYAAQIDNMQRLHQKGQTDISYYCQFINKVKCIIYQTSVNLTDFVDISALDTIYTSLSEYVEGLKKGQAESGSQSEQLESENLKLKEVLEFYIDKYTKIVDRKNSLINGLQEVLDKNLKSADNELGLEYQKLKELKEKDQQSYEGEIKVLKQNIADIEASKNAESTMMAKLKEDNTKLNDKNKFLTQKIDKLEKENKELKQKQAKDKSEQQRNDRDLDKEISIIKGEYEEMIQKLEIEAKLQAEKVDRLTEELTKMHDKQSESETAARGSSDAMKNLLKAFNLLKKTKKLLDYRRDHEIAKHDEEKEDPIIPKPKPPVLKSVVPPEPSPSMNPQTVLTPTKPTKLVSVTKPSPQSIKKPSKAVIRKRDAKDEQKQSEDPAGNKQQKD